MALNAPYERRRMVAQVIVDLALADVDRVYDYTIPEDLPVQLGSRVNVPFGRTTKQGFVLGLSETTEVPANKLKDVKEVLDDFTTLREEDIAIARYLASTYHIPLAHALRQIVPAKLRGGRPAIGTRNFIELAISGEELLKARATLLKKDGTPRYPQQIELLDKLEAMPGGLLFSELPKSTTNTLLKKGFVRVRKEANVFHLDDPKPLEKAGPISLAPQQQSALTQILGSEERHFLLHGVTGSGKTEVYIRVIQNVLDRGQGAILLVPEIALTPQIYNYLRARLDTPVALFHSNLSDNERFAQWLKVRKGEARVVLGPRSAVFAPMDNLGVIIIDEEQETSYRSSQFPTYSTKEIALLRSDLTGCKVIAGSATPSVDTYKEMREGKWELVHMPDRLFDVLLPPVEVVDMRQEVQRGNYGMISEPLDKAIREALGTHKQIMILLNRRGYSSALMCPSCGHVASCDNCDVSMTFHKDEGMLKCHFCGAKKRVPSKCPECGGVMRRIGIGTQKLEETLHEMYPSARILRMDADTMRGHGAHLEAYESFLQGKADILVGTQMIAKGFDFENVTVAAVVAADTMLHQPDFRSGERSFAQITQLAGRAGRRGEGKVYVQTHTPEHYAVTHAAQHDFEGFFEEESAYRQKLLLPPYGEHIMVRFTSDSDDDCKKAAKDFMRRLTAALDAHRDAIIKARASESPLKWLRSTYRYQILLHLKQPNKAVEDIVFSMLDSVSYKNVLTGIEINPEEMY